MLIRRHWSPRYVVNRVAQMARQRRRPNEPWWAGPAIDILDDLLQPTDVCFEWGSGRSTRWLAERTARVESIEHDAAWHARVSRDVLQYPTANLRLVGPDEQTYVGAIRTASPSYDVIVVDGLHRDACAAAALERIRRGGLMVIDNIERHLASASRSPEAIGDNYETAAWREWARITSPWRRIWTTNGVTDTAIFLAPSVDPPDRLMTR